MLMDKKAQVRHVFKWLLYIPMTAVIVFLVVYIPNVILDGSAQTQELENDIFAERIYNEMSVRDDLLFRTFRGYTCSAGCFNQDFIDDAFDNSGSLRRLGFNLTFNDASVYFNRGFYEDAVVLWPVRYDRFVESRPVFVMDRREIGKLLIDQVYSGRLDEFE